MPPTENYQVMLYVSIDPDQCPINVEQALGGIVQGANIIPGINIDVGYIDNADYEVGA